MLEPKLIYLTQFEKNKKVKITSHTGGLVYLFEIILVTLFRRGNFRRFLGFHNAHARVASNIFLILIGG